MRQLEGREGGSGSAGGPRPGGRRGAGAEFRRRKDLELRGTGWAPGQEVDSEHCSGEKMHSAQPHLSTATIGRAPRPALGGGEAPAAYGGPQDLADAAVDALLVMLTLRHVYYYSV